MLVSGGFSLATRLSSLMCIIWLVYGDFRDLAGARSTRWYGDWIQHVLDFPSFRCAFAHLTVAFINVGCWEHAGTAATELIGSTGHGCRFRCEHWPLCFSMLPSRRIAISFDGKRSYKIIGTLASFELVTHPS